MKLGLFGGTFDPPHNGHIAAAEDAAAQFGLNRVFLIPVARPPLKEAGPSAGAEDRLGMLRAAAGHDPRFEVSDFEVRRGGVSYSIETVRHFREHYPDAELFLIVGADQWGQIGQWKDVRELVRLVTFVVVDRPGEANAAEPAGIPGVRWHRCEGRHLHIGSTDLRARLREGSPVDSLVPPAVAAYISERKLYANP
jgi:nicotinate-nucleotide adenylyltransferase